MLGTRRIELPLGISTRRAQLGRTRITHTLQRILQGALTTLLSGRKRCRVLRLEPRPQCSHSCFVLSSQRQLRFRDCCCHSLLLR